MRYVTSLLALVATCGLTNAMSMPSPFSVSHDKRSKGFSCPPPMSYSPWIKACACPPGQSYDAKKKDCTGDKLLGPWPEPSTKGFSIPSRYLATFCAISPTKIVKYSRSHKYCQASVNTITFSSKKTLAEELKALQGGNIDLKNGHISSDLKDVCAGLSGLYVANVKDAVTLFNTDKFGLETLLKDVAKGLPSGIIDAVKGVTCLIGIGKCKHDCVSYCTDGCSNLPDVIGTIGDLLEGLNGLCILDGVVEIVNSVGKAVGCLTDDLLCTVGNVLKSLLDLFDCDCEK